MKRFENYEEVKDLLSDADREKHEKGIVTTFEMDELTTRQDILDRHRVMRKCHNCQEYTEQDTRKADKECANCGQNSFDPTSTISLRTYNPNRGKSKRRTHHSGPISWNDPQFTKNKYKV